jgi:hypothetical protein
VENANNDYSSLSSFTFGAATSSRPRPYHDSEGLSPLAVSPSTGEFRAQGGAIHDRTPRPSIFQPHDENDAEDVEAIRNNRAKMRAIDNGTRRPSLPTNIHSVGVSDPTPGPSTERTEDPDRSSLSDVEIDADGLIDTDVEYDLTDAASVHTFGFEDRADRKGKRREVVPWEFAEPSKSREIVPWEYAESEEDEPSRRRGSTIAPAPRSPADAGFIASASDTDMEPRGREGSVATLRRGSRSVDDELRLLSLNSNQTLREEDAGTSSAWEGVDLRYITGGFDPGDPLGGADSRRSSLSFVNPLSPRPVTKGKKDRKQKAQGAWRARDLGCRV